MADIQIKKPHSFSREEAKRLIKTTINNIGESLDLICQWNGYICNFKGSATGYLVIKDYTIEITADLSFAAKLLKSTIERMIEEELNQVIG